MASVLEHVPMERISAEAREVHVGEMLLTLLAGLFYVLGWVVGKIFVIVSLAVRWSIASAKVGWQDAHRPSVRTGRRVGAA